MRRLLLVISATLLALVAVVSTMTSASAAHRTVRDRAGDAGYAYDIQDLYLNSNANGYVEVLYESPTFHAGRHWNGLDFYLDTRNDSRWDYHLIWDFKGDGDGYATFRLNSRRAGVSCSAKQAKSRIRSGWVQTAVFIPRNCLRFTKMVRVMARTWDFTRYNAAGRPTRGRSDTVGWHTA